MDEPTPGMLVTPNVRLLRALRGGSMGSVWLAEHRALDTQVVVKFMSPALFSRQDLVVRFSREAAAASRVKSPHVVQMLDHGITESGLPYIIMEHLEGHDLQRALKGERKLPPREVAVIIGQLAKALGRAHDRDVLHRDLKPSNVFLCDVGNDEIFVKLLDFGVARAPRAATGDEGDPLDATQAGALLGTPYYMSPEQLTGGDLDARSDLWALGVLAFRALTGKRPFTGDVLPTLTIAVCSAPLPVPSALEPSLPPAFDRWFARACARNRNDRFSTARELAESLAVSLDMLDVIPIATGSGSLPSLDPERAAATVRLADSGPREASAPGLAGSGYNYESHSKAEPPSIPLPAEPRRGRALFVLALVGVGVVSLVAGLLVASRPPGGGAAAGNSVASGTNSAPPPTLGSTAAPSAQASSAMPVVPAASSAVKPQNSASVGPKLVKPPPKASSNPEADPFGEGRF